MWCARANPSILKRVKKPPWKVVFNGFHSCQLADEASLTQHLETRRKLALRILKEANFPDCSPNLNRLEERHFFSMILAVQKIHCGSLAVLMLRHFAALLRVDRTIVSSDS
jgi:hypothetical protein